MKHRLSRRVNSPRFALRKPYKILLCCLLNAALTVFAVFEGMQYTSSRAAVEEAMASRIYAGTIEPRTEGQERLDAASTLEEPISEEALAILEESPWIASLRLRNTRAALFADGKKFPAYGVQQYVAFVGRISGKMYRRRGINFTAGTILDETGFQAVPSVITAGDPDAYPTDVSESEGIIVCNYENEDCVIPVEQDAVYFFFGKKNIRNTFAVSDFTVYHADSADGIEAVLTRGALIPKDDPTLSDEEFGARVIREFGLETVAARLDDAVSMIEVVEVDTPADLLAYYNGKLRVPRGRMIEKTDRGRAVCMVSPKLFSDLKLAVGAKLSLRLADTAYRTSSGGWRGIPELEDLTVLDYGKARDYEVIGTFSHSGYPDYTIFIPKQGDVRDAPTDSRNMTFTLAKDDYEKFLFETEPLLNAAGYNVILVRPDYADLEAQFDALEQNGTSTVVTSCLALAAGLALTAGMLILFWRPEYTTQRILGAKRREAVGVYGSVFAVLVPFSLLFSAAATLLLGVTGLSPALAPENLTLPAVAVMVGFAAAELALLAVIVLSAALIHDRKRFGKG